MAKANKQDVKISIPAINIQLFTLRIVGDSPLIVHAWSEKAKREMLGKQMKKAKAGKEAKDPWMDFVDSLYWLSAKPAYPTQEDINNAKFGFPAVAFKTAAVDAGYQSGATANKTTSRAAFHIVGDMVEIKGTPTIREDMVRIGMGTADIRYRGEFKQWEAVLNVRYNANAMSMEQIINLFSLAGFACGIGEWRPQKDGAYGMFHVE